MDKQSETEIRARISEADWALSNLELLKGTTFQAGVMLQNQVQRIRLLYDMLGEFEKTEATDLSNPTEPTYPPCNCVHAPTDHGLDDCDSPDCSCPAKIQEFHEYFTQRASGVLQATSDRTKTEALAGKSEDLQDFIYNLLLLNGINATNALHATKRITGRFKEYSAIQAKLEAIAELNYILENSSGGGSWRRIILQRIDKLKDIL